MDLSIVTTMYWSAPYLEEFYERACAAAEKTKIARTAITNFLINPLLSESSSLPEYLIKTSCSCLNSLRVYNANQMESPLNSS